MKRLYVVSFFRNNSRLLELADPEVGASGVEADNALEACSGTRATNAARDKRKHDEGTAAPNSLVESSASMAAFAATHR